MTGPKSSSSSEPTLTGDRRQQSPHELIDNRFEDDDAAAGCAALPALLNAESTAQLTAWSRSASSHTTNGFFPPSSSDTRASRRRRSAEFRGQPRRTGEADDADIGDFDQRCSRFRPEAVNDVEHAGGQTRLLRHLCEEPGRARRVLGDFRTTVFPQTSAGTPSRQRWPLACSPATMRPATPIGWRIVIAWRPASRWWSSGRRGADPRWRRRGRAPQAASFTGGILHATCRSRRDDLRDLRLPILHQRTRRYRIMPRCTGVDDRPGSCRVPRPPRARHRQPPSAPATTWRGR